MVEQIPAGLISPAKFCKKNSANFTIHSNENLLYTPEHHCKDSERYVGFILTTVYGEINWGEGFNSKKVKFVVLVQKNFLTYSDIDITNYYNI